VAKSLFNIGRKQAEPAPTAQPQARDEAQINMLQRELAQEKERITAGMIEWSKSNAPWLERRIAAIERDIEARAHLNVVIAERARRGEKELPGLLDHLHAGIADFEANDLPRFVQRVRDLEAEAKFITTTYGVESPLGAVTGIPDWLCLAQGRFSFAAVLSSKPDSPLTLWKNLAARFGFLSDAVSRVA
jgi:hypothetical protein